MKTKYIHIATFFILGIISFQNVFGFSEPQKGSRLYLKPSTKKNATITFTKGKSVLPFAKSIPNSIDLKPAKTVNLYFSSYLIGRNLSTANSKEQVVKATAAAEKETNSSSNAVESGEKFFAGDGLSVSNIYPNPADDFGNFDYSISGNNYRDVKIEFFNVLGSPMDLTVVLEKFDKKVRVSLKEFSNGIYFYQLIADGKTLATKKLLVRHYN